MGDNGAGLPKDSRSRFEPTLLENPTKLIHHTGEGAPAGPAAAPADPQPQADIAERGAADEGAIDVVGGRKRKSRKGRKGRGRKSRKSRRTRRR